MCPIRLHSRSRQPTRHQDANVRALVLLLWAGVVSLGMSGPADAQAPNSPAARPSAALADPTRPPAALAGSARTGNPTQTSVSAGTFGMTTTVRPARPPVVPPQLQALHLPRDGGPPSALVDGRLLHIGDRLGDWTVQAIRADAVWLRQARGTTQRLALLPALNPSAAPTSPAGTEEPLHLAATAAASAHTVIRKEP
jgi:hypothetical protein